jgi:Domain of unknown function (DUF4340)
MSPRNFSILALATAASIALAVHAVAQRETPIRVEATGVALFPGLLDRLNDVREVRITMPTGKLTVKAEDQGWSLAEKTGYPVDPVRVRDLALALANLQLIEAKTADPQRLGRLDLDEPGADAAGSRLVELLGGDGAPLASAVVGKASPSLYGSGRGGVYVRRAADNQAWLAAGELDLPADAMELIGSEVIDVPLDQVARVVLQPPGGPASTLSRPELAADFVMDATLPEGRKLDPVKVESLAGALSGLTMTDVRPSSEITVAPDARRVRFETFAGGAVDVTLAATGEGENAEQWLMLKATGKLGEAVETNPSDQSVQRARRLDGWAFKVPAYLADRLGVGLDQLLLEPPPAS